MPGRSRISATGPLAAEAWQDDRSDGPRGDPSDDAFDDVPDEDDAPRTPPAALQPEPLASDEGVVAAYTVGDSAYAMLVDGRIKVTTPEGSHMFHSMDELKAFMVARRAEASAG